MSIGRRFGWMGVEVWLLVRGKMERWLWVRVTWGRWLGCWGGEETRRSWDGGWGFWWWEEKFVSLV